MARRAASQLAMAGLAVLAGTGALGLRPAAAILERAGEHIHDAGAFRLFMTNLGVLGNPTYPSFSDHPSLEWPAGTANEFLLEAGLWVGARDRRGMLIGVSTSAPVSEFRPSLDPVDRIYRSFDGDQGTRRLGSTLAVEEADDDGDGVVDEEFLNGKDDDGDGLVDEDYLALGSQTFACEYMDDTPEAQSQLLAHTPLGLRVRQLSFTWSEGVEDLDRCAVIRYEVINTGTDPLYDIYLGFFVDPDVGPKAHDGYWRDDRFAIETVAGSFPSASDRPECRSVPFELPVVVMEDVPDGEPGANGGDTPGVIAACMLDHTTHRWGLRRPEAVGPTTIVHLGGRASVDRTREQIADADKYALMSAGTFTGSTRTDDHRFVLVAGPFDEVRGGESLELTVALILAADRAELARTLSVLAGRFHGRWADLDGSIFSGRAGAETCLLSTDARFCNFTPFEVDHDCDEPLTQRHMHAGCRNPFIQLFCPELPNNDCTPRQSVNSPTRCTWVDWDCDPCTPDVTGGETLVHWADTETRVSSRPVGKRISPGDRRVLVEWDNAAELPTAARVLPPVAGYRVWRAEGWTRPPGSSGPRDEQWQLVAELPLPGSGLPPAAEPFIVDDAEVIDSVPGPGGELVSHYEVGRYRYVDDGVLNGFAVFYDVTPFATEEVGGGTLLVRSLAPRAGSGEEVSPIEEPSGSREILVVPNPYVGSAAWDLEPSRTDPSGRRIAFTGLPDAPARIQVFTLAGDLVRTLDHGGGSGAAYWDLLSRNGQPVVSGIYIYTVEAPGLRHHGKLVIVK